jgi:cytochrome oxidase Cu insertion factor (SCO1/SenC/PrrC family)
VLISGVLLLAAAGCAPTYDAEAEEPRPVQEFSFIDQDNGPISRESLLGNVWVASFIFTRCGSVCPQVCGTLARLQHDLENRDGVVLVSFSVDPAHDTPAVLKEYAARYGADPKRWRFVTGDRKQMYELIEGSFQLGVQENRGTSRTPGNEVTHSTKLVVVDRRGRIRGRFDGRQTEEDGQAIDELPRLKELVDRLIRERP